MTQDDDGFDRFRALVQCYQARVAQAMQLFERYRGLGPPSGPLGWRQRLAPHLVGHLDPARRIAFRLKGQTCEVTTPEFSVIWDFGPAGESDGFDSWRLWKFIIANRCDEPVLSDEHELRQQLVAGISHGLITRRRHLYIWS